MYSDQSLFIVFQGIQYMSKQSELLALAKLRQSTRWYGYKCIGDYHAGVYECDFVSPYTKTAGNVDSEIMVILQDWASDEFLGKTICEPCVKLGYDPCIRTNKNLSKFLDEIFKLGLKDVYGTNLFPFIKLGDMSSKKMSKVDLIAAANQFALPQIHIVNPKLVICLGLVAFNALQEVCDFKVSQSLRAAIESPFNIGAIRVWYQKHPSRGGLLDDWQKMKADVFH